jgi:hypothetical protein
MRFYMVSAICQWNNAVVSQMDCIVCNACVFSIFNDAQAMKCPMKYIVKIMLLMAFRIALVGYCEVLSRTLHGGSE